MKANYLSFAVHTILFLLFLVVLSYLLLLANGFKINFQQIELTRTGIIYLAGEGKGIIKVDDKLIADSFPAAAAYLNSGRYYVLLEKEDYMSKRYLVNVKTDLVTLIDKTLWVPKEANKEWINVFDLKEGQNILADQGYFWKVADGFLWQTKNFDLTNFEKIVPFSSQLKGVDLFGNYKYLRTADDRVYWFSDSTDFIEKRLINVFSSFNNELIWQKEILFWGSGGVQKSYAEKGLQNDLFKISYWQGGWIIKARFSELENEKLFLIKNQKLIKLADRIYGEVFWNNQDIFWLNSEGELRKFSKDQVFFLSRIWGSKKLLGVTEKGNQFLIQKNNQLILMDIDGMNFEVVLDDLKDSDKIWLSGKTVYRFSDQKLDKLELI